MERFVKLAWCLNIKSVVIVKTGFAGFGFWWLHFSSGDCAGGSQRACVAGTINSPASPFSFYFWSCAHHFFKLCSCYSQKTKLEKSWYAEKVGAGLHIVAAVTESCVTGHAMNWFSGSNHMCGWSEVSNIEDGVLLQVCSMLQFGENREEVIMGRRSRKCKLRPTGGQAISTSPCLGRWLRGSGMALKVTASFVGDLNWAPFASASVGASFEYLFQVNHFYM